MNQAEVQIGGGAHRLWSLAGGAALSVVVSGTVRGELHSSGEWHSSGRCSRRCYGLGCLTVGF